MPLHLTEKERLWKERIDQCQASNQSIKKWCCTNHINYKTFIYWKTRLSILCRGNFTELFDEKTTGVEVEYNGARIHLTRGFDSITFTQCLQVLRKESC